ncbi:hypothetical protein P4233_11030 [Pseudomonas aeruginosa]|nr:hypothetical protein [Pseudomonas aeruginosa]
MQKCRKWAGRVGEIKISDDSNPVIAIQLSGVDTESILEQAKIHDNDGARRKLTKDLLFEAFGVQDDNQLFIEHPFAWRGTRRTVEVMFQNIREISDFTTFEARGDDWKVLVDFRLTRATILPRAIGHASRSTKPLVMRHRPCAGCRISSASRRSVIWEPCDP